MQATGRLFRKRGFEAVTVAEVMTAAGLAHGGFYGHSKSKNDLFAQAIFGAVARVSQPSPDLAHYSKSYLSETHSGNLAPSGGTIPGCQRRYGRIALRDEKKLVDKTTKGAKMHRSTRLNYRGGVGRKERHLLCVIQKPTFRFRPRSMPRIHFAASALNDQTGGRQVLCRASEALKTTRKRANLLLAWL
jgi:AcrR family transcriptional regulator